MFRVWVVHCFAVLISFASVPFAQARDEPQASRFVLDFSEVHLQSGERVTRTLGDLSVALNVILGCEFNVPDDPTQVSRATVNSLNETCPRTVAKWEGPVTYWMGHNSDWLRDGDSNDALLLDEILAKVGDFVGITFEPVSFRSSANIEILLFDREEKDEERERLANSELNPALLKDTKDFLDGVYQGRCKAMWKTTEVGYIEKYRLLVDAEHSRPDREAYLVDCIVRSMGLRSHFAAQHLIGIATNPSGERDRMYGLLPDALRSLELLYRDQMETGMSAEDVFRLH